MLRFLNPKNKVMEQKSNGSLFIPVKYVALFANLVILIPIISKIRTEDNIRM